MTNERAVEILNLDLDILGQYGGETAEAYKMAIQALEAQPSEDCIKRQAGIKGLTELINNFKGVQGDMGGAVNSARELIKTLPPVTPRRDLAETSQDCISREEVQDLISRWLSDYLLDETREALETINYKVGDMPSVTPERPKGKWIKVITNKDEWGETWHFKCSICGEKSNKGYRPLENYCHNCGAEMGGADETN